MWGDEQAAFEVRFLEKLQRLLGEGDFTSTYKFAVLLGLTDLCSQHWRVKRGPNPSFTTRELAANAVRLYWPQTLPYVACGRGAATILLQNRPLQAAIVNDILRFRARCGNATARSMSPEAFREIDPRSYQRLLNAVEWKLIEMPLPRLQRLDSGVDEFIYTIGWTLEDVEPRGGRLRAVVSRHQRGLPTDFDNAIILRPGVLEAMARLQGIIRDLVESRWVRMVRQLNPNVREDPDLQDHLFGAHRIPLEPLHGPLLSLQDGRCFYCGNQIRRIEADHFLPWSLSHVDWIENLVAACAPCNAAKRQHLASDIHVRHWLGRLDPSSPEYEGLRLAARDLGWPRGPCETLSLARVLYEQRPGGAPLWHARGVFRPWSRALLLEQLDSTLASLVDLGECGRDPGGSDHVNIE